MGRYEAKIAARERAANTVRRATVTPRAQAVPRWLKKVLLRLIPTDKDIFFGEYFLSRNTVEVLWVGKVPHDAPRTLRVWKTTYRLQHRQMKQDDMVYDYHHGDFIRRSGIGCGMKCPAVIGFDRWDVSFLLV